MKLSTTTLGCPSWDLATLIERTRAMGFDAIDFRGYMGNMKLWEIPEFSSGLAGTAARIAASGLAVTCISTGIRCIGRTEADRAKREHEAKASAAMCRAFGAPFIRVFGGEFDEVATTRAQAIEAVGRSLVEVAKIVTDLADVTVLIETHDAWTTSEHIQAAVAAASHPAVGICWDIKHTYWVAHETPAYTWARLGPLVHNTHWKDGRRGEEGRRDRLCLLGEGQVPLADAYQVLCAGGYDGPLTLEWEKQWHPHIEEPEVAFPHFVSYMRGLASWRRRSLAADAALLSERQL